MTDPTSEPNLPPQSVAAPPGTLARLQQTRLDRWHQSGEALLTFENVRSWLNAAGLVLFAPRPQIPAPAPTLVEAVLGAKTPEPTLQQTEEARSLLTRLVAEGIAVPLNLLGTTTGAVGETPDFIASAGVFSYLFTLRGDKAWKQPPVAVGPARVSQLAVHAYEILAASGSRSLSDLTAELGNAVTESAVLRALGELWNRLRVLPLPQPDGRPTLWELASTRYTKQIKAGANAGQPSALSALISLYLGQVAVATEDEIEIFLSPVAPRSRTRDVLHALTAARQLETLAVEGRTMLHVAGETPAFLASETEPREQIAVAPVRAEGVATESDSDSEDGSAESGERIKKYVPKPRKIGTGPLAKGAPAKGAEKRYGGAKSFGPKRDPQDRSTRSDRPARNDRFGAKPARSGAKPERAGDRPERERRPFQKSRPAAPAGADGSAGDRPKFDRPWSEDRPKRALRTERAPSEDRAHREGRASFAASGSEETRRPRPRTERPDRSAGGWKPAFRGSQRPVREEFRQDRERPAGTGERERRPRRDEGGSAPRGGRRNDAEGRPNRFAKGPGAPKRPYRPAEGAAPAGDRPARPFRRFEGAQGHAERPKRPFRRAEGAAPKGERSTRPFRRFDSPRPGGKPSYPKRSSEGTPNERPRREFRPRTEGGFEGRRRESSGAGADRRPTKFAAKRTGGPRGEGSSAGPRRSGPEGARPFKPGGERPFKPSGARPFKPGGGRPFKSRGASGGKPPRRTFKRRDDESA